MFYIFFAIFVELQLPSHMKRLSIALAAALVLGILGCTLENNDSSAYEAVDLGLSVKWAACNLGASRPQESGYHLAWGETEAKGDYKWATYKWANGYYNKLTKYCSIRGTDYWDGDGDPDDKTVLDPEDDVAHVKLGGSWRMPTDSEWKELINNCAWAWTTLNGVNGRIVTGPNGNSIFLPAAGCQDGAGLYYAGSGGYYWSSSLGGGTPDFAWQAGFYSGDVGGGWLSRCRGFSVRPVSE